MPRINACATPAGVSGRCSRKSDGGSRSAWARIAITVRPHRGSVPLKASNAIVASANTSAAGVGVPGRACSGAMYAGVPMIAPGGVIFVISAAVASPRSATLTDPSSPTSTFGGLRSRCTTPCAWA